MEVWQMCIMPLFLKEPSNGKCVSFNLQQMFLCQTEKGLLFPTSVSFRKNAEQTWEGNNTDTSWDLWTVESVLWSLAHNQAKWEKNNQWVENVISVFKIKMLEPRELVALHYFLSCVCVCQPVIIFSIAICLSDMWEQSMKVCYIPQSHIKLNCLLYTYWTHFFYLTTLGNTQKDTQSFKKWYNMKSF